MDCNCDGEDGKKTAKKGKGGKDCRQVCKEVKERKDDKDPKHSNVKESSAAKDRKDGKDVEDSHDGKDITKSSIVIAHSQKSLTFVIPIENLEADDKGKCIEDKDDKYRDVDEADGEDKNFEDKDFVDKSVDLNNVHIHDDTAISGIDLLRQIRSSQSYAFRKFAVKDFIWSFNSIAKILACLTYLFSAVLFYKQPEEATIYQFDREIPLFVMLPVLDVFCGVSIIFVYCGMLLLLMENKIMNMIILDITTSLTMAVLLMVSILIILDENNLMAPYVQRLAAEIALVAVALQVFSGILTVIYYHPNEEHSRSSSTDEVTDNAVIVYFKNHFK